jgi:hypothetical protein
VPEPTIPHIKSALKGFEKTAMTMFGTEKEQALRDVKTCIKISSYNLYASSNLIIIKEGDIGGQCNWRSGHIKSIET